MYSRPLGTPAEEAEIARELLTKRSEALLKTLSTAQQTGLNSRASELAEKEGILQGRPVSVEEKARRLERDDKVQREELQAVLGKETAEIAAIERWGNPMGLTGAQMARYAMNAVEPVERRGPHHARREPTAEFSLQAEGLRGLDQERIKIEAEAALDDPETRANRQAEVDRPLRAFNEQASVQKPEAERMVAYVFGTGGNASNSPDDTRGAGSSREEDGGFER
jgi:hypothetical protein